MQSDLKVNQDPVLMNWMRQYADALLLAGLLLCGNLSCARKAVRSAFQLAYCQQPACRSPLCLLLSTLLRECPCPLFACAPKGSSRIIRRILRLPPPLRKAAVLCLYLGLDDKQAGLILGISTAQAARRAAYAAKRLLSGALAASK